MSTSFIERLMIEAGIGAGMCVADIGCGGGEIALLAAKIVGPRGKVIGFDQDAKSLGAAQNRARSAGFSTISFAQCDLGEENLGDTTFDAIVGRRVLTYLPDRVAALKRFASNLKPGGIAVFQESDATMAPGRVAHLPLHDKATDWIARTVALEGTNPHMGFELPQTLRSAGFVIKHVCAEAVIQGQKGHYPLAFIVRAMLPRIVGSGVATETEIDIETLEQRLADERRNDAVYVSDMAFGVWAQKS